MLTVEGEEYRSSLRKVLCEIFLNLTIEVNYYNTIHVIPLGSCVVLQLLMCTILF